MLKTKEECQFVIQINFKKKRLLKSNLTTIKFKFKNSEVLPIWPDCPINCAIVPMAAILIVSMAAIWYNRPFVPMAAI